MGEQADYCVDVLTAYYAVVLYTASLRDAGGISNACPVRSVSAACKRDSPEQAARFSLLRAG